MTAHTCTAALAVFTLSICVKMLETFSEKKSNFPTAALHRESMMLYTAIIIIISPFFTNSRCNLDFSLYASCLVELTTFPTSSSAHSYFKCMYTTRKHGSKLFWSLTRRETCLHFFVYALVFLAWYERCKGFSSTQKCSLSFQGTALSAYSLFSPLLIALLALFFSPPSTWLSTSLNPLIRILII